MNPRSASRLILAALLGGFALLLGLTAFPVVEKEASWQPFFMITGGLVALVLLLGWLVAQV